MKVPLTSGAYQARSLIASAQRCIDCFPEANPADSEFPTTHYPRPGKILLGTAPTNGWRGLYAASSGDLYGICGNAVYRILPGYNFSVLGEMSTSTGPVSMKDNSATLVIVDGSVNGYTVDLTSYAFTTINDPAFYGSNRVDIMDDFLLFNQPNTRQFYVSGALAVTFDPLDIAAKNGAPDKTVGVAVVNRTIFIFGQWTTEIWYNAGAAAFVFARYPGAFIEHGCACAASIATIDTSAYWLSRDEAGTTMVFRTNDMIALRISTHALENEMKGYATVNDAVGFCYQDDGHTFYQLNFPTAQKSWCFDLATQQWHERSFLEADGSRTQDRAICFAQWNGVQLVGDYASGALYQMTTEAFDDAGNPISCLRTFPHMGNDENRMFYDYFIAQMEVGTQPVNDSPDPVMQLRWSDTRGKSWGTPIMRSLGPRGKFDEIVRINCLGQDDGNGRIFEVSWSAGVQTALNGAYIGVSGGQ